MLLEKILDEILKWEGAYSNDPDDLGGETKFGVTYNTYLQYKDALQLNDWNYFSIDDAKTVYYHKYLTVTQKLIDNCDKSSYCKKIALLHAHLSVNTGPKRANILLQEALNDCGFKLKVDGIVGPKTLTAFKRCDKKKLYHEFLTRAVLYYCSLNQRKFLRGWIRRILSTIFFEG